MTISTGNRVIKIAMAKAMEWPEKNHAGSCVGCGCTQKFGGAEGFTWAVDPNADRAITGRPGPGLCDPCLDEVLILCETPADAFGLPVPAEILKAAPINTLHLALYAVRGDHRRAAIRKAMKERG